MAADNVFHRIKVYLQNLIKAGKLGRKEWEGCDTPESLDTSSWIERPRKLIKLVKWIPPDCDWIKLNTKGVWSQSGAGAGGIIRDSRSGIVGGFMKKVNASSSLDAELQAVSLGLDMARERGQKVWIELDSMEVISMIQHSKFGPANLRHLSTQIRNNLKRVEVKSSHCYNAGNRAAEFAARHGCIEDMRQEFDHNTAPAMIKALVRMDQLNIPNFQFLMH